MGKDSGGGSQTVVNKTELPEWVQDAGKKNLAAAYDASANLMGPYQGPRVANMTDGATADIAALQNNVGSTNPAFASAQNTAAGVANYNPAQVQAGQLSNTNLSSYMNPYTQNVIGSGLQAIDMQRQQALNQNGDQAIRAGAFGGSRHGVVEGITNSGAAMQAGTLSSNLMNQNFMQAQNAANTDLNRNLQGQISNQSAGLQGAALNLNAANSMGNLAEQGQNSFLKGLTAALTGQGAIQGQNQAGLDANKQLYQETKNYPLEQLQIPLQALGATPYGQTNTQTGPGPTGNPLMSALGAGSSAVSMIGGLMSIFSDERAKTDVQKVGADPETGLNLYAYRYKGDPKSYPKVVGPMAQEIEKKYPDQVATVGGKKVVNLGFGPMQRAFN
ncbi:hypothetical protein UFOVP62_13 [uncultured Caudovirales phage]|uniref:Peptidase S74 domain-containing protein n=1 Tax=uncultured Caudovirales phage TaxID=2100421 RepID=A0A6J5KTW9_9CAUD|nr:hypothetical protein UFOVP62_13 [uncultured Caudovirales phage]